MSFPRKPLRYKQEIYCHSSLDSFCSANLENGIHSIAYGNGLLDLMIEDRNAETTIVFFHGAVPFRKTTLPVFSGLSVSSDLDANLVLVSDPGLENGTNLTWYAGDSERNLQHDLANVLIHVLRNFASHKYTITYGSSGGGFASLIYAAKLPNCTAMTVNPQTEIGNYHPKAVERFTDTCWNGLPIDAVPAMTKVSDIYGTPCDTRVVYIQAMGDEHVSDHMTPFFERVHPENHVGIRFLWNGVGHQAPHKELVTAMLEDAISSRGDWEDLKLRLSLLTQVPPQELSKLKTQYLTGLQ